MKEVTTNSAVVGTSSRLDSHATLTAAHAL